MTRIRRRNSFKKMSFQHSKYVPSLAQDLSLYQNLCYLFIYLGFYIAFNTVQIISQRVVGRAEETSTYSLSGFCTVNC